MSLLFYLWIFIVPILQLKHSIISNPQLIVYFRPWQSPLPARSLTNPLPPLPTPSHTAPSNTGPSQHHPFLTNLIIPPVPNQPHHTARSFPTSSYHPFVSNLIIPGPHNTTRWLPTSSYHPLVTNLIIPPVRFQPHHTGPSHNYLSITNNT